MINWITDSIGRWTTPDPEEELMMVGHVLKEEDRLTLVHPPVLPGLPDVLASLGSVRAIILTTHDHTRGSRYLSDLFACPIYAPVQADRSRLDAGRVQRPEWYEESTPLPGGLVARRTIVTMSDGRPYMDEMSLQRSDVLFIGDLLTGNLDGTLAVCPEQFPGVSDVEQKTAKVARALLGSIGSAPRLVLAGHGWPFSGDWQAALTKRVGEAP
ncbi:MAG: MBL fold metallo-hydrolase [Firmicutes bacterium]|nr:MBL fold metallo-hydrolase [Bacillota bacterium]